MENMNIKYGFVISQPRDKMLFRSTPQKEEKLLYL
jgi:hypothetical protein